MCSLLPKLLFLTGTPRNWGVGEFVQCKTAEHYSAKERLEVRITLASSCLSKHIQSLSSSYFDLRCCVHNLAELTDEALSPHYI